MIDEFRNCPVATDRLSHLKAAYSRSQPHTLALEFGVYAGASIRALALANPQRQFHGFDSFAGLPEDWRRSENDVYKAGHFALMALPAVPKNVTLVSGFFEDTLRPWLAQHDDDVGFVHIDADIYSAAKYVLTALTPRFADGAIIVFDELCDWQDSGVYPAWEDGEWRALQEWLSESRFRLRVLSRCARFEAAVQVFQPAPSEGASC